MVGKISLAATGFKVIDALGKQVTGKLDGNGFAQVTGIAPDLPKLSLIKILRVLGISESF